MLLDKLQFGFLLFETQQGLVKVELSFAQRIYLLWTFRNFRRLSIQLLNPRQRALVNSLFRRNAGVVSQLHKPLPAIGVVEDFAPPPMRMGASPVEKKERRDKVVAQRAENAADSALLLLAQSCLVQAGNHSRRAFPLHHFCRRMASNPGSTRLPSPQSASADERNHPNGAIRIHLRRQSDYTSSAGCAPHALVSAKAMFLPHPSEWRVQICRWRFLNRMASGKGFRCGAVPTVIFSSPCKTMDGTSEKIFVPAGKSGSCKVGAIAACRH